MAPNTWWAANKDRIWNDYTKWIGGGHSLQNQIKVMENYARNHGQRSHNIYFGQQQKRPGIPRSQRSYKRLHFSKGRSIYRSGRSHNKMKRGRKGTFGLMHNARGNTFKKSRPRRRTYKRKSKLGKYLFRHALAMAAKNVYRKLNFDSISFANNTIAIHTRRLFQHSYQPTSNAAGTGPLTEIEGSFGTTGGILKNFRDQTGVTSVQTTRTQFQPITDLLSQFNPSLDPVIRLYMKAKMKLTFKNNSGIPVEGLIYVMRAKMDMKSNATTTTESTCDYVPDALMKQYLASDLTQNSNTTAANLTTLTFVNQLGDAKDLISQYWKKTFIKHIKLEPGDEYSVYIKHRPRIINLEVLVDKHKNVDSTNGAYIFKGEPIVHSYWHGPVAHDAANLANQGFAKTGATAGNLEAIDVAYWKEFQTQRITGSGRKYFFYDTSVDAMATPFVTEPAISEHTV